MAATDIVELIGKTVALKKRGKNYLGLCPFHSEKSPSFNVDPVKQFFHCFGCKASGDSISFVMKRDRVEFLEALHLLGDAAGIERPAFGQSKEKAGQRKQLLDANSAAGVFFEKMLAHPSLGEKGRSYLSERGFNAQSIQNFHLGLAADAWDALLKSQTMRVFDPQLLHSAGLVKARDGGNGFYDTFRNRLMFPIRDENGRVIAFGGRIMPGSDDKAKYLNSPETPLFSKSRTLFGLDLARQRIVETRTVAIVEGYTDVVMAHQYGASNVVSVLGTAMTESHVSILRRFADRIVLLFDADNAGDTAVNRAVELFLQQPIEIAIAGMPDGVDPDEYLIANGAAAFDGVLKSASDALTYKWRQLVKEFNQNGSDMTGQQKAVQQYMQLLANARGSGPVDPMRWAMAISQVARLTEIPVDELNRMFRVKKSSPFAKRTPDNAAGNSLNGVDSKVPTESVPVVRKPKGLPTARDRSERWILAVLLAEPGRWESIQQDVHLCDFADEDHRRLAEVYWQHQRDEGEPVFNEFLASLTDPYLTSLTVSLIEEFDTLTDPRQAVAEATRYLSEQKKKEDANKLLAALKRTGDPGASPANDPLYQMQEKARKPDLRRTGS